MAIEEIIIKAFAGLVILTWLFGMIGNAIEERIEEYRKGKSDGNDSESQG